MLNGTAHQRPVPAVVPGVALATQDSQLGRRCGRNAAVRAENPPSVQAIRGLTSGTGSAGSGLLLRRTRVLIVAGGRSARTGSATRSGARTATSGRPGGSLSRGCRATVARRWPLVNMGRGTWWCIARRRRVPVGVVPAEARARRVTQPGCLSLNSLGGGTTAAPSPRGWGSPRRRNLPPWSGPLAPHQARDRRGAMWCRPRHDKKSGAGRGGMCA
jgi:hypothetical protein